MKKMILGSIVLAAVFTACGGGGSCCDSGVAVKGSTAGTPPVAAITNLNNNTTVTAGQSLTINGMASSDRDGTVKAYAWTIDGQAASTEENPTFTFNTPGSHEVCLTVTDNDDLNSANVECRTVVVGAVAGQAVTPTAVIDFTGNNPIQIGSDQTFSCANSHDNDTLGTGNEIVSCSWDIRSYKITNGTETPYRNCSAANVNTHQVRICEEVVRIRATLTVTDNDGQTHSTTREYTQFSR
jgi:PKD repeat protein